MHNREQPLGVVRSKGYIGPHARPGVVGVRIVNCEFARTAAGVGVLHRACDNWIIGDNTRFVRLADVGLACHSSGVHLRDCRFETKQDGAGLRPHVPLTGDPDDPCDPDDAPFTGGQSEITGCRFGRDAPAKTDGPPAVAIEVRPLGDAALGPLISRNWFNGRNKAPTETSARNVIAVYDPDPATRRPQVGSGAAWLPATTSGSTTARSSTRITPRNLTTPRATSSSPTPSRTHLVPSKWTASTTAWAMDGSSTTRLHHSDSDVGDSISGAASCPR